MRIVFITVGLLCLQILFSGCSASLHVTPEMIEHMVDSRWECPKCGHSNGNWSTICSKCGESRPY